MSSEKHPALLQSYTLHYFNVRGRGELVRYMFVYAGIPFTDNRMTNEEYMAMRPNLPLGQVPVLEINKRGSQQFLCQSGAIIRHVAVATGLNGKTLEETTRADECYESLREIMDAVVRAVFIEREPARKEEQLKQVQTELAPRIFAFLEKRLVENGGKNLAGGTGYTYADMFVAQYFDHMIRRGTINLGEMQRDFPNLMTLANRINDSPAIASYLLKRPITTF